MSNCDKSECSIQKLVGGKSYTFKATQLISKGNGTYLETSATQRLKVATRGLRAVITTTQITVSQEGRIKLNGRLSEDQDRDKNYELTFDWYCQTASGGLCTVIDSEQSIEEEIGVAEFRRADLDVPADVLPPGQYIFTLNVSKGEKWSEAKANVTVTLESIPQVEIWALDNLAWPDKKFVATGKSITKIGQKIFSGFLFVVRVSASA